MMQSISMAQKLIYVTINGCKIDDVKTCGLELTYGLSEVMHPVVKIMNRHFRLKC